MFSAAVVVVAVVAAVTAAVVAAVFDELQRRPLLWLLLFSVSVIISIAPSECRRRDVWYHTRAAQNQRTR